MSLKWTEGGPKQDVVQKWTETVPCRSTSDPPLVHLVRPRSRRAGHPRLKGVALLFVASSPRSL